MAYNNKCLPPNYEPNRTNVRNSVASSVASSITVQVPLPTSQLVCIGVKCPATGIENTYVAESTESVGHLRRNAVVHSGLTYEEAINYGLYLPQQAGKKGKFLEDERPIADYPILLQGSDRRSRNTDDTSSASSATATLTNGLHNSPDSGVGQDPCWLELIYKSRMNIEDSPHNSRLRKLKTKVTQSYFMDVVRSGNVKAVEKLLAKGFDPNFLSRKDGEAPITVAAMGYHPRDMIIALVNGGAHLDFRARNSFTALHRAAMCGNYEAIQTLLDLGQNPNCRDQQGLTPLYHAVSTDISARCTHALLYDHAILGVENSKGYQEIHQACLANCPQHLENLIAYGADLNARTLRGQTPLHLCVSHEANACLNLLLQRGADVNQVNYDNQTPLEYALLTNRNEQADILSHFDPANIVAIKETPSYNTLRRPVVNGPRAAVAYTLLHRPSSACTMADVSHPYHGSLSPSESLFSADQASVTSFIGANYSNAYTATTTIASSRSMQNIQKYFNEDATPNPIKQLQQLAGTPRTKRANLCNDPKRKTSAPVRATVPLCEPRDENVHTRTITIPRGCEGFGFTLHGVPREALLRHDRQPLPNTPSNEYFSSVVPGGPADRAGIREGDYVIEINGQDVTNACHEDAVECIKNCGDLLTLLVTSMHRASALHQSNGRSGLPRDSRTYQKRRQGNTIYESSSSSGTSSNGANSDTEVVTRTSFGSATRKSEVSRDTEQKWREPQKVEVRSRSRERRYRNSSVRSQSYSGNKEEIHLNATSPAAHSGERVFVFRNVNGKTRAVPLEDPSERKDDPRKRSVVRFAGSRGVSPSGAQRRRSLSLSCDAESGHINRAHPMMVADHSDSGGEASTTIRFNDRDTTSKTLYSGHVTQPFQSSHSVGCLRRIDPGDRHDDDEEEDADEKDEEEGKGQEEDNRCNDDDGRGVTAMQRYATSKRSLPRLELL